jgi:hypothetical protein
MTALRPHSSASSRFAAFRIQKPPTCSLVSRYGPSVIHHLTVGLRPQGFRVAGRGEATSENPGPGSIHLFVECADIAFHYFALE